MNSKTYDKALQDLLRVAKARRIVILDDTVGPHPKLIEFRDVVVALHRERVQVFTEDALFEFPTNRFHEVEFGKDARDEMLRVAAIVELDAKRQVQNIEDHME